MSGLRAALAVALLVALTTAACSIDLTVPELATPPSTAPDESAAPAPGEGETPNEGRAPAEESAPANPEPSPDPEGTTPPTDTEEPDTETPGATDDVPLPEPTPAPAPEPTPTPTPEADTAGDDGGDRLVVQSADGQLSTVRPDGSDEVPLTDAADGFVNLQPTWAPDGSRIAWSRSDPADGAASMAASRFDRSGYLEAMTASTPFYLAWSAPSTHVAFLAPGPGGLDVGVVDVTAGEPPTLVDRGQPYYFSWAPDGDELFVHASEIRLDRVDLDGATVVIDENPGAFQAPVWTPADRGLIFADRTDGTDFLVSTGIEGQGRRPLISYDGFLSFVVNPDANRIAYQVTERANPDQPGVVTTSYRQGEEDETPTTEAPDEFFDVTPADLGFLEVVAIFGGPPVTVSDATAIAFFWSPTGEHLAYLVPVEVDGETWFEWRFWDGRTSFSTPAFRPSETLATDYLPFFDQYAQSVSFWAPDGSAIVYAGTTPDGQSGVFVQPAEPGTNPLKVADGVFAAWSPTGAGTAGTTVP